MRPEHLVALWAWKRGLGNALVGAGVRQVVLAQGICPLEGLPTPMAQERARPSVHIGAVPHQVLLAVCLVAALGALVQGCAALQRPTVT